MLRSGLTGGIGAGKSTVAAGLARRGAAVIDADVVAREVVEPGGPAYGPVAARFGADVLQPDGRLDRRRLAAVVFADVAARADLDALTHPVIGARMLALAADYEGTDRVVVFDVPLLDAAGRDLYGLAVVLVVDAPVEVAVRRLVEQRGYTEADARARVAAQIDRERRLALADRVIDNSGDREALEEQIDEAWSWLQAEQARRATRPVPPGAQR